MTSNKRDSITIYVESTIRWLWRKKTVNNKLPELSINIRKYTTFGVFVEIMARDQFNGRNPLCTNITNENFAITYRLKQGKVTKLPKSRSNQTKHDTGFNLEKCQNSHLLRVTMAYVMPAQIFTSFWKIVSKLLRHFKNQTNFEFTKSFLNRIFFTFDIQNNRNSRQIGVFVYFSLSSFHVFFQSKIIFNP